MPYQLQKLSHRQNCPLDERELRQRIERLISSEAPRYRRLWLYFRNPMLPVGAGFDSQGSNRPYRLAQEWGLPSRITGMGSTESSITGNPVDGVARKEIAIENDIGWRIETMVDFLFGKSIEIKSTANDPALRERIEELLRLIFANHGGVTFLQQLGLLGAVYGFVDVLVKFEARLNDPAPDGAGPSAGVDECEIVRPLTPTAESAPVVSASAAHPELPQDAEDAGRPGASLPSHDASLERIARSVRLEIVEPARALPLLNPNDWREVVAYVQCYRVERKSAALRVAAKRGWVDRLLDSFAATRRGALFCSPDSSLITEILTVNHWQRYEDEKLITEGTNSLGILPLVHIQNTAVPFEYSGTSDVEAILPLQDELNARLCDRANRITMQSFKMYLGKGIDNFTNLPVGPGRMWMTDNEQAQIIEFGGDAASPSEDRHIAELREAMDKTSGVTPIAAGILRNRIGHLTSGAALRVTMLALLARTERKRITYGGGIARLCELALAWLDHSGLFHTSEHERHIEIHWPDPIPLTE